MFWKTTSNQTQVLPQRTPSPSGKTEKLRRQMQRAGWGGHTGSHYRGAIFFSTSLNQSEKNPVFTDMCQRLCDRFRIFPESQLIDIKHKFPAALQSHPHVLYLRIVMNGTMQGNIFKNCPASSLLFQIVPPSFREILFNPSTHKFSWQLNSSILHTVGH